ncbi:MAG TPA: RNA-binding protein [Betaproteobacteria bacterium]|nr:RNA-binding protein [Betaproteobacteria bacterium]
MDESLQKFRLDKWLWAALFFKTRALAAESADSSKVQVNGARAKAARQLRLGDTVMVRQGPYEREVIVRRLSSRRGPAAEAQQLYRETEASCRKREELAAQCKAQGAPSYKGRPTKKARRQIHRFTDKP